MMPLQHRVFFSTGLCYLPCLFVYNHVSFFAGKKCCDIVIITMSLYGKKKPCDYWLLRKHEEPWLTAAVPEMTPALDE